MTTPEQLITATRAYQTSALLIALAELDVCERLATYPDGATAQTLAEAMGLNARTLAALLGVAVAVGLLEVRADLYFNTELSRACLLRGGSHYQVLQLQSEADQYRGWGGVADAVRDGRQVLPDLQSDHSDPSALRRLLISLDTAAQNFEPTIRAILAPHLARARKLLDVGAGLGTFGRAWAEVYPDLEVTLLDRPAVLDLARQYNGNSPARARLNLRAVDYKTADFGDQEYDLVLLFRVLRTESPATNRQLLHKAGKALKSGGVVVVFDSLLDEGRASPAANVLRHLNLTLTYAEGGLFSLAELGGWLDEAGFASPKVHDVPTAPNMSLVISFKKNGDFDLD